MMTNIDTDGEVQIAQTATKLNKTCYFSLVMDVINNQFCQARKFSFTWPITRQLSRSILSWWRRSLWQILFFFSSDMWTKLALITPCVFLLVRPILFKYLSLFLVFSCSFSAISYRCLCSSNLLLSSSSCCRIAILARAAFFFSMILCFRKASLWYASAIFR